MNLFNFIFGKRPIYKRDVKSGGWTVSYRDVKGIRGQGYTKTEALECLKRDIEAISKLEKKPINKPEFSPKAQVVHS